MDIRKATKGAGTPVPLMKATTLKGEEVQSLDTDNTKGMDTITTPAEAAETNQDYISKLREEMGLEGYTDKDYFEILDTVITQGDYEWKFSILGKIECLFHIRPDWVQQSAIKEVERVTPKTLARFTDIVNRYNLAGALLQMGGKRFTVEMDSDLDAVLTHIGKLPFAVVNLLVSKLVTFDRLVAIAMSPWALENFIEPQSEN